MYEKKEYYYYFASGKVVISRFPLSIIDIVNFEAKYGNLYYPVYY
jgi:hypothetical protein